MDSEYVWLLHIVVVIIMNVSMVIWKSRCVHCINSIQLKQRLVRIFKLSIVNHGSIVSILVSSLQWRIRSFAHVFLIQVIMIILLCVNLNLFVVTNPMEITLINIDPIVNFITHVSKVEHLIIQHVNMVIVFLFNIKNVYLPNKWNVQVVESHLMNSSFLTLSS